MSASSSSNGQGTARPHVSQCGVCGQVGLTQIARCAICQYQRHYCMACDERSWEQFGAGRETLLLAAHYRVVHSTEKP